MSDATKAVFLSYASQDAEAAKRIADALRTAGVEVWFDAEGGLEHGDEWDAKIRKQVKECVLFIAVISANTQAREEGYFRLEWDMAAERARSIASGVAFILPVVVDDTREADALVPDRFRTVQWTRLPGGMVPAEVLQRFLKLWSHRTGALKQAAGGAQKTEEAGQKSGGGNQAGPPGRPGAMVYAFIAAAIAVVVAGVGWWFLRVRELPPVVDSASGASPVAPGAATATAMFPRDPELKRAWDLVLNTINATAEDFALAEDIVKGVLAKRSTDPETVIVYAWVNDAYINRGFDLSEERYVLGRRYTERAVQLAPDNPEALAALGQFLSFRNADMARAEQLLRRAIELNPHEPRFYRALSYNVLRFVRPEDGVAVAEKAAGLFPTDPLVAYETYLIYRGVDRTDEMERALDRTLALAPIGAAMLNKSWISAWLHGDVAGMKHWLDQVPASDRLSARTLIVRHEFARLSGQPDDLAGAVQALQAYPGPVLHDFWYDGPKALLLGDLYAAQGQREFAQGQFEAALAQLARDKAARPGDLDVLTSEGWALLGLGRGEAALADFHILLDEVRGKRMGMQRFWSGWFNVTTALLLLGDRAAVLPEMKFHAQYPNDLGKMRVALAIDPRLASFREDPEIKALLAEPKTEVAAVPAMAPDAKSVAVLAFTNLSEDKDNEYFSDGISEELLNVLAKIPDLKVTARTSSFYFKGKEVPIPEIARQLGVAYVIEGSVRKSGSKVRITAQLIKAADGFQIWSDTFTRELKDVFAVQDEIAGLIAKNLSLKLGAPAAARREVNPEAYRLVLEGRHFWNLRTNDGFDRAEASFRRAIALDPDYASAHAGLANVLATRLGYQAYEGATDLSYEMARTEAQRANALDPAEAEGNPALGLVLTNEGRLAEADGIYRTTIALNPSYALPHHWRSLVLELEGRIDEALIEIQRAVELDPLSGIAVGTQARMLQEAGRHQEAFAAYERAAAILPDRPTLSANRAVCLLKLNRRNEAVEWARKAVASTSRELRLVADADATFVLRQTGHETEAAAHAEQEQSLLGAQSYQRGAVLAAMGRLDEALPYLEHTPISMQYTFYWNPVWDAWREDPRFVRLLEKLGRMQEYQTARETAVRLSAGRNDAK